tara:strand:+ start:66 stop:671 length:606 start_codon:yes stop_codon:yes gene_type:complete
MFSSINKLNICKLNPSDSEKYEKIMLFRNPYIRTISCFLDWMIRIPNNNNIIKMSKNQVMGDKQLPKETKFGWLIPILLKEKAFDFDNYKLLLLENNIIELFKIYLKLLPKIKYKNQHMHSQVNIIKDTNFSVDTFINIDKKQDIMILKEKIKQYIPINNKSCDKNKQLLSDFIKKDTFYNNIIYYVYQDDFYYLNNVLYL